MGKYIPQLAFLQVLLGDQPVLAPHERLYQRLLASNRDEADLILAGMRCATHLSWRSAMTVIVPAMLRAEDDHDRGTLLDAKRQIVFEHIEEWVDERLEIAWTPATAGLRSHELADIFALSVVVRAGGRPRR